MPAPTTIGSTPAPVQIIAIPCRARTARASRLRPIPWLSPKRPERSEASADTSDSGRAGAVVAAGAAGAAVGAIAGRDNDAALESERVRSPEDSTEILSNVTSYETADEEPVNRTDEVGAAAVAGTLTGAEAVGLMTRQGAQCSVVDPESDEAVRWDMARTPVTLNPCGLGSMNLSKVSTVGQRGSGAAGQ